MGIKHFIHEVKTKVTASRLFKALFGQSKEVIPKATTTIKSVEIEGPAGVAPGCVLKTNFSDGSNKYLKHRIDAIDHDKNTCKFTLVEGEGLGDKYEKICYELKLEDTADGGCVAKVKSEYHGKGDVELTDEEIKAEKEQVEHLYKACEEYLIANPHVCA